MIFAEERDGDFSTGIDTPDDTPDRGRKQAIREIAAVMATIASQDIESFIETDLPLSKLGKEKLVETYSKKLLTEVGRELPGILEAMYPDRSGESREG
ncbi:hypothetical protein [Nitratifractor sp.]